MSAARRAGLVLGCAAALACLAGSRRVDGGGPPAGAGPPATAAKPARIARAWIAALRVGSAADLTRLTEFPFVLRDTGTEGKCKSTAVSKAEDFPSAVACLTRDHLLGEELKANPEPEADAVSKKTIPRWARRWASDIGAEMVPVSVFIPGNGVSFDLVIVVAGEKVRGLFKHATFESN